MFNSFTMTMHIILVLPFLLQMTTGRPQQQTQLVTQMLPPNQAATLGPQSLSPAQGPAASLGQIFLNLLNYKLQWLNQLAGQFTGLSPTQGPSFKPALLGALGALGASQISGAPGAPGTTQLGHPHHGYPFMTTLVTTLSGNAPTVPGITIAGAPVNHLATPGFYPGAPTTPPPQDFHWVPPFAPESPQIAQPQATITAPQTQAVPQPITPQPTTKPPVAPTPLAQPPQSTQTLATIPVIPAIDDVPLQAASSVTVPPTFPVGPVASPPAAVTAPAPAIAAPVATVPTPAAPLQEMRF